jgi:hypothetical protein
VKPLVTVVGWPSPLVRTTSTTPEACGGVKQVIVVELTNETAFAAMPPKVTASDPPLTKPVPVMVTAVPPDPGP